MRQLSGYKVSDLQNLFDYHQQSSHQAYIHYATYIYNILCFVIIVGENLLSQRNFENKKKVVYKECHMIVP